LDDLKTPCFEGVVSMGRACSRFHDTYIQRFAENLYHDLLENGFIKHKPLRVSTLTGSTEDGLK
jgi:hypothetical protein